MPRAGSSGSTRRQTRQMRSSARLSHTNGHGRSTGNNRSDVDEEHQEQDHESVSRTSSTSHLNGNGNGHRHDSGDDSDSEVDADAAGQSARDASLSPSSTSSPSAAHVAAATAVFSSDHSSSSSPSPPSSSSASSSSSPSSFSPSAVPSLLSIPQRTPLFAKRGHLLDLTPSTLPALPRSTPSSSSASSSISSHFSLPTPSLTPELRRDLRLLALRPYLDPKRFYKRSERKVGEVPKEFAMGVVVTDASEWWASRESRGERRAWLADKVKEEGGAWLKRRFDQVQEARTRDKWRGKKTLGKRRRK